MTNLELYGTEDVPPIPADICNERIRMLDERLFDELAKPVYTQDGFLIKKIGDSIRFWKKMRDGENAV